MTDIVVLLGFTILEERVYIQRLSRINISVPDILASYEALGLDSE